MSLVEDALPRPEVYYDPHGNGKSYLIRNDRGNFLRINEGALKRHLKALDFSTKPAKGDVLDAVDKFLDEIIQRHDVDYAGPLAGYLTGVRKIENRRILVTEPPFFITPESGEWETLKSFFKNLLGEIQVPYFFSWLKVAISTLRSESRRPGQVLVIAGSAGCGKSFLQNLITQMLGGRSAKPYQFMTGATQFNSELFQAEHLMIEDEVASFDLRVRRALGANLKAFTVNESQRCHPKNRPGLTLHPFWRISITLNDEAENLMVLPPLDESLQDKMMIFRAAKNPMPMPTETPEQWRAFKGIVEAELPHFIDFILNVWRIDESSRCPRYGVKHYHHPELLQMMSRMTPEAKLMEIVDTVWKELPGASYLDGWEGKASELEKYLLSPESGVSREASKVFLYPTACGQYLSRLQGKHPDRISHRILSGYAIWRIAPPKSN